MRKWRLPLTYQPKIEPVLLGTCRQTIRMGRKKRVGDLIRFYVWSGKAYRSKQVDLTEYEPLKEVINIKIVPDGVWIVGSEQFMPLLWDSSPVLDLIAERDCIIPPTGKSLKEVLTSKNGKIPTEGIEAQILR